MSTPIYRLDLKDYVGAVFVSGIRHKGMLSLPLRRRRAPKVAGTLAPRTTPIAESL